MNNVILLSHSHIIDSYDIVSYNDNFTTLHDMISYTFK
jgi:hypothetical protein